MMQSLLVKKTCKEMCIRSGWGWGGSGQFFIGERQALPAWCAIHCSAEGQHKTYTSCQPCFKGHLLWKWSLCWYSEQGWILVFVQTIGCRTPSLEKLNIVFLLASSVQFFSLPHKNYLYSFILSERNLILPVSTSLPPQLHFFRVCQH